MTDYTPLTEDQKHKARILMSEAWTMDAICAELQITREALKAARIRVRFIPFKDRY